LSHQPLRWQRCRGSCWPLSSSCYSLRYGLGCSYSGTPLVRTGYNSTSRVIPSVICKKRETWQRRRSLVHSYKARKGRVVKLFWVLPFGVFRLKCHRTFPTTGSPSFHVLFLRSPSPEENCRLFFVEQLLIEQSKGRIQKDESTVADFSKVCSIHYYRAIPTA
jgi:hypothetical protein